MSVSEVDFELLEGFLDGELSSDESETLRRRIATEPSLAAALAQVRRERNLRQQVYLGYESNSDAGVNQVMNAVRKAITRDKVWSSRVRIMRQISAAAACLIVGLFAGWIGHSHVQSIPAQPIATDTRPDDSTGKMFFPGNPNLKLTSTQNPPPTAMHPGGFNVSITDNSGRVLAVQHFDTLNEASEFSNDLGRWQKKQRQMRNSDVKLVGDEF